MPGRMVTSFPLPEPGASNAATGRRLSAPEQLNEYDDDGPDDAAFSDDEELPTEQQTDGPPFVAADGFDFSGSVHADASCESCPLCDEPFDVSWDEARQALVVLNAVTLRNQTFHTECLARRRGPS